MTLVHSMTPSPSKSPRFLLQEITRGEAARRASGALAVLPVGATEQHGPHLPLGTDFLIVEHVARAAALRGRPNIDVLVAPTFQIGSSHHHLSFGGTISLATEQYYGALRDMVTSLIGSGFRRIFIINGHGGNHEIIQLVVRDLALSHGCNLAAASYWELARKSLAEHSPDLGERLPGHAGAFETSLIMALHPDLVSNPLPHRTAEELARTTVPSAPFRAERHGFWQSIDGFTDSPDQASAERGQQLLEIIIAAVAAALVSFAQLPLIGDDTTEAGQA